MIADGMTFSDYREQFDLAVKVRELAIKAGDLTASITKMKEPLEDKLEKGGKLTRKETLLNGSLDKLKAEVVTAEGPYPQPMLNDQVSYLYSMITSTDQKPGKDAYMRYNELLKKYSELKEEHDRINN
jgi:hypothetical protein